MRSTETQTHESASGVGGSAKRFQLNKMYYFTYFLPQAHNLIQMYTPMPPFLN